MAKEKEAQPEQTRPPLMTAERPKGLVNKMAWVRTQVDFIAKRGVNEFHKYKYIQAGDVQGILGALMGEVGIILHREPQSEPEYSTAPTRNGTENVLRMKVRYTFIDGDAPLAEAERLSYDTPAEGRDSADKCIYKLYTGALKYVLIQAFCLGMGDDPEDGAADRHREEKPTSRPDPQRVDEPPPSLNASQVGVLLGLCEATKTDIAKLVEHYAVADPEHLPYERAFNALQKKLKKQEADAPKAEAPQEAPAREPGDEDAGVPQP